MINIYRLLVFVFYQAVGKKTSYGTEDSFSNRKYGMQWDLQEELACLSLTFEAEDKK